MRPDALELVLHTIQAIDTSTLPERSRLWLSTGLQAHLAGASIDEALDLRPGPGEAPVSAQFRQAIRDEHLRCAGSLCTGSPWQRAVELSAHVNRFAGRTWKRLCNTSEPPANLSAIDTVLFVAFHVSGGDIPSSPKRLSCILRDAKSPVFISATTSHDWAISPTERVNDDKVE